MPTGSRDEPRRTDRSRPDTGLGVPLPRWPDGADAGVSLTFDVDAESSWLAEDDSYRDRLTTLSEARFGVVRGLPRLLALLDSYAISATFYVPGATAERHPAALESILSRGHEVGHHGYLHLRSNRIDADAQRREIELGLRALQSFGVAPAGYRSASWELTPTTFGLLTEYGFHYDSSCMGDDRPYVERFGDDSILELPVHWSLVDSTYFTWTGDDGGHLDTPRHLVETWLAEFESAVEDRRHVTFTMHPEIIGRGHRMRALRELLDLVSARGSAHYLTHNALAELLGWTGTAPPR